MQLQFICKEFCSILQPLLYTHIQLRDFESSVAFLTTLSTHEALAISVQTLQVGFSPLDLEEVELVNKKASDVFWELWNAVLPRLIRMTVLGLTYSHDDPVCLQRYLTRGGLRDWLPASVRRLHLKPTPEDYLDELPVRNTISVDE